MIDGVVCEQSEALERKRTFAEEVSFLKDEVDRLELVLRKDNLKFLSIPETALKSYEACVQKVVDALGDTRADNTLNNVQHSASIQDQWQTSPK